MFNVLYHPECIGLQLKEEKAEKLTAFNCPSCVERRMDSPLYHESEYYFLSYFFSFDKMLIATETGCQKFFECESSISMPSFLTTPSIQWTKEQLQVRPNTNFQHMK